MLASTRRIVPAEHDERHRWMAMLVRASIAFQVQTLRLSRNWTQAELARRAGVSTQEINRIEKPNGQSPSLRTLLAIARACDCGFVCRFSDWDTFVNHMAAQIPPDAYSQDAVDELVSAVPQEETRGDRA